MRAGLGWTIRQIVRRAVDWPGIAVGIVVMLIAAQGPTWLTIVAAVVVIAGLYGSWSLQRHWARLRRLRRMWADAAPLMGLANRDGVPPRVIGLERTAWGDLVTLGLLPGHSVPQIERAVPELTPFFGADVVRVERVDAQTVYLRCVSGGVDDVSEASWQQRPLATDDPRDARPHLAEETEDEGEAWFTSEPGDLPR